MKLCWSFGKGQGGKLLPFLLSLQHQTTLAAEGLTDSKETNSLHGQ